MKRSETIIIESVLYQDLFGTNPSLAKEYGTTEVTIQFPKKKKELVDFMSYEARKDIFRCYEIKVSMNDFHSKAAKSWYGNYNYLVLSRELYMQQCMDEIKNWTPEDKERAKQLFEEMNLENIRSGPQNPSDGHFEFILPNGETTL